MQRTLLPGKPYPLGATPTPKGTNFALFSENATGVSVCFFDEAGNQTDCVALRERPPSSGTASFATSSPASATAIASRAHGSRRMACASTPTSCSSIPTPKRSPATSTGRRPSSPMTCETGDDLTCDEQDSPRGVPKCIVIDPKFDWKATVRREMPLADSVIYEVHVRGFSNLQSRMFRSICAALTRD